MPVLISKPMLDDGPAVVRESTRPPLERGRPISAHTKVFLGHPGQLSSADFSFMRASLQGVKPLAAAKRYLLDCTALQTSGAALQYRDALIERLLSAGTRLSEHGQAMEFTARKSRKILGDWWQQVRQFNACAAKTVDVSATAVPYTSQRPGDVQQTERPGPADTPGLPSLDDYLDSRDWDGFSLAEILEEFEATFGVPPAAPQISTDLSASPTHLVLDVSTEAIAPSPWVPARLAEVSQAIGELQGMYSVSPHGSDLTQTWLVPTIANRLRPFGVITLGDLANWINLVGKAWYSQIQGVGITKARRIVQWLIDHETSIGVSLSPVARLLLSAPNPIMFGQLRTDALRVDPALTSWECQEYGIVPLQYLDWPVRLRGQGGVFRADGPNTLGATDDAQALALWLAKFDASPQTSKLYTRAVECLTLWAIVEKQKPISSLNQADLREFQSFLARPPAHWIQSQRVSKKSRLWRPLRGPLRALSIESLMRVVSALYTALHAANYLCANPAQSLTKAKRDEIKLDTSRSLTDQDLDVVALTFAQMPDGVRRNRFRAIMLLLQTTGLRKSEAIGLRWTHVSRAVVGHQVSGSWKITFVGKGGKERSIPLPQATYQALLQHREDRQGLTLTHKLAYMHNLQDSEWPLIGIIDETPAQAWNGSEGDFIYNAAKSANTSGALSAMRLHELVKDFFEKCGQTAKALGADPSHFEKASAHWMRHTFAHLLLDATDKDLAVTQELLGHSSIATTSIYTKADMGQRIQAIQKLKIGY